MRGNQTSHQFAYVPPMLEKYLQFILVDSETNGEDKTNTDIVDNREKSEKNELADDDE